MPVMVTNDGRKYKMLVLILDLAGAVGSERDRKPDGWHVPEPGASQQPGVSAWEINPQRLLNVDNAEGEHLLRLIGHEPARQVCRAIRHEQPSTGNGPARPKRRIPRPKDHGGRPVRGWSQVDYNGRKEDAGKSQSTMYGGDCGNG
ncbi:MAG: hypothetical protein U0840_15565 [Gemmataceae bacterium]